MHSPITIQFPCVYDHPEPLDDALGTRLNRLLRLRTRTLTIACSFLLLSACSRTSSQNASPEAAQAPAAKQAIAAPQFPRCPSGGIPAPSALAGHHKVTLSWKASLPSPAHPEDNAVGYCLYRSPKKHVAKKNARCSDCEQVNSVPVVGTACVDDLVADGATYYYVSTAINSRGTLSTSSNEVPVSIPSSKQSTGPASAASYPLCRQPATVK